nr:unnamed protein product [Callosobruchus chinensis]
MSSNMPGNRRKKDLSMYGVRIAMSMF